MSKATAADKAIEIFSQGKLDLKKYGIQGDVEEVGGLTGNPIREFVIAESVLTKFQGTRTIDIEGREATIHSFTDLNTDEDFDLWGSGMLDKKLEKAEKNDKLWVLYMGTQKIKKGKWKGKAAHIWNVYRVKGK